MKIVQRKIAELRMAEYNSRRISKKDFDELKASLKRFGAVEPAVVNMHPERKNVVIGGHQRLKAGKGTRFIEYLCIFG